MDKIRIRILTSLATMTRTYEKGDVTDWDKGDAQGLFKAGYAEPLPAPEGAKEKK